MTSAMPDTAPCSTSFAAAYASSTETSSPSTSISLSLGMMISESTLLASAPRCRRCATRCRLPSNLNGRVTTATVRMPRLLAMSAMTGAAPVPVPPPMPAVMNSMSAPSIISAMRSRSSIAASRPISGFAPAPRPRVSVEPSCSCVRAVERFSACASVFAQMNSTPDRPRSIMCSTALPPQPPTPMTLMTAPSCGCLVDDFEHGAAPSPVWFQCQLSVRRIEARSTSRSPDRCSSPRSSSLAARLDCSPSILDSSRS